MPSGAPSILLHRMNHSTDTHMIENKRISPLRATFLGGALALAALAVAISPLAHGKGNTKTEPPRVVVNKEPLKRDIKLTTSFAPVVKKVAPSVVNVFISSTPKNVSFETPQMFDE